MSRALKAKTKKCCKRGKSGRHRQPTRRRNAFGWLWFSAKGHPMQRVRPHESATTPVELSPRLEPTLFVRKAAGARPAGHRSSHVGCRGQRRRPSVQTKNLRGNSHAVQGFIHTPRVGRRSGRRVRGSFPTIVGLVTSHPCSRHRPRNLGSA